MMRYLKYSCFELTWHSFCNDFGYVAFHISGQQHRPLYTFHFQHNTLLIRTLSYIDSNDMKANMWTVTDIHALQSSHWMACGANVYIFLTQRQRNPLTLFIAWYNLDLGVETCFFHGLTWLQFVFPVSYIGGLIIVLAKYSD